MNADIQAQLDIIKAPAQAQLDAANALPALIDKDKADFGASEFTRGQNSIILPSPTLPDGSVNPDLKYTQADMDKAFQQAKDENAQAVIDAANSAKLQQAADDQSKYNELLASVQAKDAALAAAEADKAAAVEAKRKEIMDDYAKDVETFVANHSAPVAPTPVEQAPVDPSASVSSVKKSK